MYLIGCNFSKHTDVMINNAFFYVFRPSTCLWIIFNMYNILMKLFYELYEIFVDF